MKFCFSILFLVGCLNVGAAQPQLQLSEKHLQKVLEQDNPFKKRKAYLRYFHKDSLRYVKEVDRYWQAKFDSATTIVSEKRAKAKERIGRTINQPKDIVKRLEATAQINKEMYQFPSALEIRYSQKQLQNIYSSMRYYLVAMSKDTAGVLNQLLQADPSFKAVLDQFNKPGFNAPLSSGEGLGLPAGQAGLRLFGNGIRGLDQNLKGELKEKLGKNSYVKGVNEIKGDAGKYIGEFNQYKQYANMTPDSLVQSGVSYLKAEAQDRVLSAAGFEGHQKQMNQFNQLQSQYKGQLSDLQDSTARKEMAKKKAEELAMQSIADNPGIMQAAQKKMNLLMKKYSYVPNSNDLSTAIKRTSLAGRTFRERLVLGTNFQVLSIDPFSFELAPQAGYRFNSRLTLGIGGTYRQTFKDSIATLSPEVFGYKAFVSYDLVKSFFAYSEYAQNSPGVKVQEGISKRIWKPAALLGVGRKLSVHKKIDMTIVAIYNIMHTQGDPIYPKPFVVRVGFQLSDIAWLKN